MDDDRKARLAHLRQERKRSQRWGIVHGSLLIAGGLLLILPHFIYWRLLVSPVPRTLQLVCVGLAFLIAYWVTGAAFGRPEYNSYPLRYLFRVLPLLWAGFPAFCLLFLIMCAAGVIEE
jgi:hypothetical protein